MSYKGQKPPDKVDHGDHERLLDESNKPKKGGLIEMFKNFFRKSIKEKTVLPEDKETESDLLNLRRGDIVMSSIGSHLFSVVGFESNDVIFNGCIRFPNRGEKISWGDKRIPISKRFLVSQYYVVVGNEHKGSIDWNKIDDIKRKNR